MLPPAWRGDRNSSSGGGGGSDALQRSRTAVLGQHLHQQLQQLECGASISFHRHLRSSRR
jgi:hypothetical protein